MLSRTRCCCGGITGCADCGISSLDGATLTDANGSHTIGVISGSIYGCAYSFTRADVVRLADAGDGYCACGGAGDDTLWIGYRIECVDLVPFVGPAQLKVTRAWFNVNCFGDAFHYLYSDSFGGGFGSCISEGSPYAAIQGTAGSTATEVVESCNPITWSGTPGSTTGDMPDPVGGSVTIG